MLIRFLSVLSFRAVGGAEPALVIEQERRDSEDVHLPQAEGVQVRQRVLHLQGQVQQVRKSRNLSLVSKRN